MPERQERWHVYSVIISEEFLVCGIGKMFMREVLSRAENENVNRGLREQCSR